MDKESRNNHKAAYVTAIIAFIIGWGLVVLGFFTDPTGEVHGSVLAVLGEAMVYAASVFGVTLYFQNQMAKFRHEARRYMDGHRDDMEEDYDGEDNG